MFSAPSILLFDLFGDLAFGLGGLSGARGQLVQVPQLMPLTFCVTLLDVLVESVVESRSAAVFWIGTGKTMRTTPGRTCSSSQRGSPSSAMLGSQSVS